MLIPRIVDLIGVVGRSLEVRFTFAADGTIDVQQGALQDPFTPPLNLEVDYDPTLMRLELDGVATLVPGVGLSVDTGNGIVDAHLSPSATASPPDACKWRFVLVRKNDTDADEPLHGVCRWVRS